LGNVRAEITPYIGGAPLVTQARNYYTFGMEMSQLNNGTTVNKYQYNGKELQDDFGLYWYDYGARFYDPALGRFHTLDPMAEKHHELTSYAYCANNPILFIDPDGRDYYLNLSSGQVQYVSGSVNLFNKGYVHLAGNSATYGQIQEALSSRGYNYSVNNNVPGGFAVDTRSAYKGWATMQIFSPENVGTILMLGSADFGGNTTGGRAFLSGLGNSSKSVWGMNALERGLVIEKGLGGNLPRNFPVIDKLENGVATSIKSLDLTAQSYQKGGAVLSRLKGYINTLSNFSRGELSGVVAEQGVNFTSKTLEVAVQPGKATLSQWEQIGRAMEYAKNQGVEFSMKFVK
jgi:RHS repeat-associated protein